MVVVTVLAVRVLASPPYVQGGLSQRACKVAADVAAGEEMEAEAGFELGVALLSNPTRAGVGAVRAHRVRGSREKNSRMSMMVAGTL
jgi:hypothetical protein